MRKYNKEEILNNSIPKDTEVGKKAKRHLLKTFIGNARKSYCGNNNTERRRDKYQITK